MGSAYFDAHSLWQQSEKPLFTALSENTRADTCIVGAGIAGLSVAYQLLKSGHSVVVLDRERLGLGETGLSSAHLSNALDERYLEIIRLHGAEGARLAAQSHGQAIDEIERIITQENIDCDFQRVDGFLFLDPNSDVKLLLREKEAAHSSGLGEVTLLSRAPLQLFDSGPCLKFPRQAQFHPLKYLNGLAEAVRRLGGRIHTHSEAIEISGGKSAHVTTSQGLRVDCAQIVVATNTPVNNRLAIHTKNAAYRSYVVGVAIPEEKTAPALLWDTADPYHYLRFVKDPVTGESLLLCGGEDHRTGQDTRPELHFENLRKWIETHLDLRARIINRWSGQIMEPIDGMAYIGKNPGDEDNVYIISGDSGHGLTHGTIAGILIKDLINGRENAWANLYDPSRLYAKSLGTFISEAAHSTWPYADWIYPSDVKSVHEIEPGEGAVVREGLSKTAVYKDEMNHLHCVSAVCPHLGGIVRWNSAEKTWDCPCHGSRFDRFGQVLNGPAISELPPAADPSVPTEEFELNGLSPNA
jgi:glycine/D-amino acid oxidase-like deaminating enzyme/nitrite reductase/ring-hydroxylating ferredoxin subunit